MPTRCASYGVFSLHFQHLGGCWAEGRCLIDLLNKFNYIQLYQWKGQQHYEVRVRVRVRARARARARVRVRVRVLGLGLKMQVLGLGRSGFRPSFTNCLRANRVFFS